jgi:hemerythrin-like domain-containing protein
MKPIGPLMREHRLIERMIAQLNVNVLRLGEDEKNVCIFVSSAVDFFRMYADRTHHGKEEDILFKRLAEKKMPPELIKIMKELVLEHMQAREMVGQLFDAGTAYRSGNVEGLKTIKVLIQKLSAFYPVHIEKEDKRFFYPAQEYLTKEEQDAMLGEFREFDRNMIHEKYRKAVEVLENG